MLRIKHKHNADHVVIVSTDAADPNVKQFRIKPWMPKAVIILLCVIIGAMIGYLVYEGQFWDAMSAKNKELQAEIVRLEGELLALEEEKGKVESHVEELNEQIVILSQTINEKLAVEAELREQLEGQSMPTEFPLTGSAAMAMGVSDHPICIFTASVGSTVVATAGGSVTAVNDDEDYGHSVWVDHGNGYITIYRNKGEVIVKAGDSVVCGTSLFIIGESNTELGYQMQKDGEYIDPMDMLAING